MVEIREVIALLPETGCPAPRAMFEMVEAKLGSLSEALRTLQAQIDRLEETRKYIDRRMNVEPRRGGA